MVTDRLLGLEKYLGYLGFGFGETQVWNPTSCMLLLSVYELALNLGISCSGDTRRKKKFLWANLQRIVEKRGRTGKKGAGWHPSESNKKQWWYCNRWAKKGRQVVQEKNRGMTPSVASPGVTHPSDATDIMSSVTSVTHFVYITVFSKYFSLYFIAVKNVY